MIYSPPLWIKEYAEPKALEQYEQALEVLGNIDSEKLEQLSPEEFAKQHKTIKKLIEFFWEQHLYIGNLIAKHGSKIDKTEYLKTLTYMKETFAAMAQSDGVNGK
tara:strand:- start:323 stop:637 length:315 start_codon:yes stop_codon:yes gene_type:complete